MHNLLHEGALGLGEGALAPLLLRLEAKHLHNYKGQWKQYYYSELVGPTGMNASNLLMPIGYAYSPTRICEIRRFPARNPDTSMEVNDLYLYIIY